MSLRHDQDFYRRPLDGVTAVEALRQGQLSLPWKPEHRNHYYWRVRSDGTPTGPG